MIQEFHPEKDIKDRKLYDLIVDKRDFVETEAPYVLRDRRILTQSDRLKDKIPVNASILLTSND